MNIFKAPPQPIIFDGTIKINQTWNENLNDSRNPEYQTVKDDFEHTVSIGSVYLLCKFMLTEIFLVFTKYVALL